MNPVLAILLMQDFLSAINPSRIVVINTLLFDFIGVKIKNLITYINIS